MRKIFTSCIFLFFVLVMVNAQGFYSGFTTTNCTGSVTTEHFYKGIHSYKTQGLGEANPELKITLNNIPNWKTIAKVSVWVYTTAEWNNGQIAFNSDNPGWKSKDFDAISNSWTLITFDNVAFPFDPSDTWGDLIIQYYNTSADMYFDEITFYNAVGSIVFKIDEWDILTAPGSISLAPDYSEIIVGKQMYLTLDREPAEASLECTFLSTHPEIATVNGNGTVESLSVGSTNIIATSKLNPNASDTVTVVVNAPDVSNSKVFANFENGFGNFDTVLASWIDNAPGPVPIVEIVDNPSVSEANPSAKVLKVSNFRKWASVLFKPMDISKINQFKFKVYTDTLISDYSLLRYGLYHGYISTPWDPIATDTWTEYTMDITQIQPDMQIEIMLSAPGSIFVPYVLYLDYVEVIAGSFIPVSSFAINGENSATSIDTANGSLQMIASDFLPANASNPSVVWTITGNNVPVVATISEDGILKAYRNGEVTIRATADGDGVYAEKVITVSNQKPDFNGLSEIAKKIDTKYISSESDFSANVHLSYDADSIYMTFDVIDDSIVNSGGNVYELDNIEIYIDMNNSKNPLWPRGAGWPATSFIAGDYQLRLIPDKAFSENNSLNGVNQKYSRNSGGYQFILNIPFDSLMKDFVPSEGKQIGFDVLVSDNDNTPFYRDQLAWNSNSVMLWNDPSYWGTIEFSEGGLFSVIKDVETPSVPLNVTAIVNQNDVTLFWDPGTDNIVVENYIILQGSTVLDTVIAKQTDNTYTVNDLAGGNYEFSVTAVDLYNNKSAGGISNKVDIIGVGIERTASFATFSPNPVSEMLIITSSELIKNVSVYSITGKLIRIISGNAASYQINFSELESGLYYVKVQTANETYTQKVLKE